MKRKWLIGLIGGLILLVVVAFGALAGQRVDVEFKGKRFETYVNPVYPKRGLYEIWIVPHGQGERGIVELLPKLNLTPEQQKKLAKLRINFQKQTLELRFQLEKRNLRLKELLLEDSPDKETIEALVDEMGDIWVKIKKQSIAFGIKLRDILTEEQWTKLGRLRGEIRGGRFTPGMRQKQKMYGLW